MSTDLSLILYDNRYVLYIPNNDVHVRAGVISGCGLFSIQLKH